MAIKHSLSKDELFTCLFSGGKDSGLALSMACDIGNPLSNIVILAADEEISLHHGQNKDVLEKQSEAMGIPNYYISEGGDLQLYYSRLARALRVFSNCGASSLVMGFIYDTDAAENHARICRAAGLDLYLPLWHITDEQMLNEFSNRRIISIISAIDSDVISQDWHGKVYDRNAYTYFKGIGINPFGEAGEFHTTLVDANIFSERLQIGF